jgi:CarD family transcriptional regulator
LFQKSDVVVHPKYGAGTVSDIRTMTYKGRERVYFCISLIHNRGELMIPLDRVEDAGLRLPLRDTTLLQTIMEDTPQPLDDDPRMRQLDIETRFNSGDYRVVMETLRDLCWREQQTKLSVKDRQLKDSAFSRLCEEFALNPAIAAENLAQTLERIIKTAMEHHLARAAGTA